MTSIFLACALGRARHASTVAGALSAMFDVTSTWHDGLNGHARDPRDDDERIDKLSTNLAAIARSDVLVALLDDGEPRCTFFEIGYAVALGKAIVAVHDSGTGRFLGDSHGMCVRLDLRTQSLEDLPRAIELAAGLVAVPAADRETLPAPAPLDDFAAEPMGSAR